MVANTNTLSLRLVLEKDKLNSLNFLDWFRNLRIVLKQERKLYVSEKSLPDEPPANASRADKDAYKKHLDDMVGVGCLMLATMNPELQKQHEDMVAYDMIEHLKELYQGQARQERFVISKALFQCKLAKGSLVGPHVLKMIGYIESLSKLGFPLGQELATDVILQSLPDSYNQFVLNFNMNEIDKTLTQLLSMLRTAENDMKKVGPKPILMVRNNKGKGKAKVPTKPKGKGKPNLGKGKATLKPKGGVSKEGNYFHCGVTGHWKWNCPIYLEEIKKAKASGTSALGIYVIDINLSTTTFWVLDTSCGSHICTSDRDYKGVGLWLEEMWTHELEMEQEFFALVVGTYTLSLPSGLGGEYLSLEFDDLLKECGIVSQLTPPGTPQWNGVFERRNRTLLDMVQSMMSQVNLPTFFWGHALKTAIFTLNRVPSKSVQKTPYEMWTRKRPSVSLWGIRNKPKDIISLIPFENKVFVARTGIFLEREFVSRKGSGRKIELEEIRESQDTTEPEIEQQQIPQEIEEQVTAVETQPPRRSLRERHAPERYGFLITMHGDILLIDQDEPRTYQEVVASPDSEKWLEAMRSKMDSMYENQVWTLVDPPEGVKPIGCKWVFKKKTDMDAMFKSIRILLAIATFHDYEIWQMDVKIAFLNEKLEEDVYMTQPEGFVNPKDAGKIYVSYALSMTSRYQVDPGEGH
ncbi:uncharacterized protein LOC128293778 [Gossypium arboreum]|uniref:uncharacterized protein LOC128293778 n=1 Tax=Gossypium arboreum TaxID=29729 RepID=UPI0022F1DCF3|nr:uncharacterized protein LOC128293778 [Gossypium arboreum]